MGAGPSADATGATPPSTSPRDATGTACDATHPGNAGPPGAVPDGHLTYTPVSPPASNRQSAGWVETGAAGCDGLVPASVPARLSISSASPPRCDGNLVAVDGKGNLAFASTRDFADSAVAFFLADGSPGQVVGNLRLLGSRPTGFFRTVHSDATQWAIAVWPDGTDGRLVRADSDPECKDFTYATYDLIADPRGGFVETRVRPEFNADRTKLLHHLELRWVDAALVPRTEWIVGTTWDYSYDVTIGVTVDPAGGALATIFFNPPMSMPCPGAMTRAVWAADDGSAAAFVPTTPTTLSAVCDDAQFAGFGSATALSDGGVAFHRAPLATSFSGWYVRYASRASAPDAAPSWLDAYDGAVKLVAGSRAYLATRRDPATCARTAEIVGAQGQVCATLALEGSDGCAADEQIFPDGTLVLHEPGSCALRWWPGLGGAR
jgi:hypothetical protein